MIYDGDWIPQSDNEYQQRLLAMTVLMVRACGGTLTIKPEHFTTEVNGGSQLKQTRQPDGSIVLEVLEVARAPVWNPPTLKETP